MKESAFYIKRADELLNHLKDKPNGFSEFDAVYTLEDIVRDTELLLFGFSENYPALLDIKLMKENYYGREFQFSSVIAKKLHSILSSFKSFIVDYN